MTPILESVAALLGLMLNPGEPEYCWFCQFVAGSRNKATRLYRGESAPNVGAAACEKCGKRLDSKRSDWKRAV